MTRRILYAALAGGLCLSFGCTPKADLVLPGLLDLKPVAGAHVINDCGAIIAPVRDGEAKIACVYFLDAKAIDDGAIKTVSREATEAWLRAMNNAGWKFAHLAVIEHYFERPKAGSDCSDVALMISLQNAELKALVASSSENGPFEGRPWRGYGIPAGLGEACGDDRKLK
jgi:hypothetical protein